MTLRNTFLSICASLLFLALIGCTRDIERPARISLGTPKKLSSKSTSKNIDGAILIHVAVNVHGPGINSPIVFNFDACNKSCDGPADFKPAPAKIEMEVPPGANRLVQFLGVWTLPESEGELLFTYGDRLVPSLSAGADNPVTIVASQIGSASGKEGTLAGRFLTGPNLGPTAEVITSIKPPGANRPPMEIMRSEVFGGWFEFFLLDGVDFDLRSADGTVIFADASLASPEIQASDHVLHIDIPQHFKRFTDEEGNSQVESRQAEEFFFGFFSKNVNLSNFKMCFDDTANGEDLVDAFVAETGPANIKWFSSGGTANDARRIGGGVAITDPACSGPELVNKITLDQQKLGDHIDAATGFLGPFRVVSGNFQYVDVSASGPNLDLSWSYLPGVFNGPQAIDGITVFQLETPGASINDIEDFQNDGFRCDQLSQHGYVSQGHFTGAATQSATVADLAADQSGFDDFLPPILLCPFRIISGTRQYFRSAAEFRGFGGGGPQNNFEFRFTSSGGGPAPLQVAGGGCLELKVEHRKNGIISGVEAATNLSLNFNPDNPANTATFFNTSGCSGSITDIDFAEGESQKTVFFQPDDNDFYTIQASPNSGPQAQQAEHHLASTSGSPDGYDIQFLDVFDNPLPMAQGQCYPMLVRILNTSLLPAVAGGNLSPALNSTGVTGTFFNSPDCSGSGIPAANFSATDSVLLLSYSPTTTGGGTVSTSSGGLNYEDSESITVGSNALAGFKVFGEGPLGSHEFDNNGSCKVMAVEPINSVGARIELASPTSANIASVTNTGGNVIVHEFDDCTGSTSGNINVGGPFGNHIHFGISSNANTESALITADDGQGNSGDIDMRIPFPAGVPFPGVTGVTSLADTPAFSGPYVEANDNCGAPLAAKDLTFSGSISPDGSSQLAQYYIADTIDFNSATLAVNGLDGTDGTGTAGPGGDGASGGGGGGTNTNNPGGDGGSNSPGFDGANSGTNGGTLAGGVNVDVCGVTISGGNGGVGSDGNNTLDVGGAGGAAAPAIGGGGGGGGGGSSARGGGGGGGAGLLLIVANSIFGTGTLQAFGGDGGDGSSANAGGGAGGGGGVIEIYARHFDGSNISCDVSGGALGNNGANGTNGLDGRIKVHRIHPDGSLSVEYDQPNCTGISVVNF